MLNSEVNEANIKASDDLFTEKLKGKSLLTNAEH